MFNCPSNQYNTLRQLKQQFTYDKQNVTVLDNG